MTLLLLTYRLRWLKAGAYKCKGPARPGRISYARRLQIFVDTQYGNCFVSPSLCLEF